MNRLKAFGKQVRVDPAAMNYPSKKISCEALKNTIH